MLINRWLTSFVLGQIAVILMAGCVDRRLTIVSDPPGALVTVNNHDIGAAPVDVPSELFIYDGVYDITLRKDGYETLQVRQELRPPWYLRFPFDFFAEVLWPFSIRYHEELVYSLEPPKTVSRDALLQSAQEMRSYAQQLGEAPNPP
ncbi:MAG: PEGA domain-containing protein [Gemmatales bacterium]|nr:PEGA domain-containing protein [Gemmatales bacterium]MDW7994899.1 PEGA domain-containing protein [Gemmatales bacterium]